MIEMIIFIVIVSIALTGVLSVFNVSVKSSADPMIRKQMLSIAESLLAEIQLKAFDDPEGDCTPKTVPSCRINNLFDRRNYNDVSDFNGYQSTGVFRRDGSGPIPGLESYVIEPITIDDTEQIDLRLPMQVEYWASATDGWRSATNDTCTGSDEANTVSITLASAVAGLAGATCVRDTGNPGLSGAGCSVAGVTSRQFRNQPNAGNFNLWLAAPGTGITGRVVVTAAVPPWLTYNWTGTIGNPVAAAVFGIDRQRPIVFRRELY